MRIFWSCAPWGIVFLLWVGLVVGLSPAAAQQLEGRIRDAQTHAPLPNATISVRDTGVGVASGPDGRYQMRLPGPGPYVLVIRHIGYQTATHTVSPTAGTRTRLDVDLQPLTLSVAPIEVIGTRHALADDARSVAVLDGDALQQERGQTLGETLARLPGVTALQTGPSLSKPVIRGLHSDRVVIVNSGVRQEGQQWGGEHAPEIDPFAPAEIRVIKGAAGVEHGTGAIGGVVELQRRPLPTGGGVGGELSVNGFSNNWQGAGSLRLEGAVGATGIGWRVRGTLRRAGDARTPDAVIDNSAFAERHVAATLGHTSERSQLELHLSRFDTDLGIYTGAHLSTPEAFQAAIDGRLSRPAGGFSYQIDTPRQSVTHDIVALKGRVDFASGDRLEAQYALQRNHRQEFDAHCRFCTDPGAEPAFDLTLWTQTVDLTLRSRPLGASERTLVVAGLHGTNQGNTNGEAGYLIPNFRALTGGSFARITWLRGDWTLEAGTRLDTRWLRAYPRAAALGQEGSGFMRRVTDHWGASGVVSALWQFAPAWSLGTTVSTAWRPPSVNELYSAGVHHGTAQFEVGVPHLSAERVVGADATLRHAAPRTRLEVSTYATRGQDFISLLPTGQTVVTVRGTFPAFAYRQTGARLVGLDGLAEVDLTRWLTLGTTWSAVRGDDTTNRTPLYGMPSDRTTLFGVLRGPDSAALRDGDLRVEGTVVRKQTRMPAGVDFAPAPNGYALLGVSAGAEMHAGSWRLRWRLAAENLLNTRYRDVLSRYRYVIDNPGRTLVLRLTVPFGRSAAE